MDKDAKILVLGHRGMVGSAICRALEAQGYSQLLTAPSSELDLRNQKAVEAYFETHRPDYVFLAAAKVGGIYANNTYRADFLYDNLMIEANVIHSAYLHPVKKLLFLGSSCIYPKFAPQPIEEEHLLTGPLEPTNEPYAIAKIAGIKLCEAYRDQYGCNFISAMPTNLYGPNDNYDLENAHVLPALLRRFHEAAASGQTEVVVWGDGSPMREFLHVDDLAEACLLLMERYDGREWLNVGSGQEVAIAELAELIKSVTGFSGRIVFDATKPGGTPRKRLDTRKLEALGFTPRYSLQDGLAQTYQHWQQSSGLVRA